MGSYRTLEQVAVMTPLIQGALFPVSGGAGV